MQQCNLKYNQVIDLVSLKHWFVYKIDGKQDESETSATFSQTSIMRQEAHIMRKWNCFHISNIITHHRMHNIATDSPADRHCVAYI